MLRTANVRWGGGATRTSRIANAADAPRRHRCRTHGVRGGGARPAFGAGGVPIGAWAADASRTVPRNIP